MPAPDDAQEIISQYVASRKQALESAMELGVGKEGLRDVRSKLYRAFVKRWMMMSYASVLTAFTERPWWLTLQRDESGIKIIRQSNEETFTSDPVLELVGSIPRFFSITCNALKFATGVESRDDTDVCTQAVGAFDHGNRKGKGYREIDVMVSAKLPDGIQAKHVERARGALAHYTFGTALLFRHGIDAFQEMKLDGYEAKKKYGYHVKFIWAPTVESLAITAVPPAPKGDPAVLFCVGGHSFLLDFYDTPDEQPIEHLIREFSEGRLTR